MLQSNLVMPGQLPKRKCLGNMDFTATKSFLLVSLTINFLSKLLIEGEKYCERLKKLVPYNT